MSVGENPWTSRLSLLVLTHVAGTVSIVSVLAMAPVVTRDLGLGATEFGFLITAYYGAQAVFSMPAGGLVDRVGVGWALIICHAVMVLGAALFSQAESFPMVLASLAAMGVGYSISNPATARGVLEWFPAKRRATAMGIKQVGVPLGGILGAGNGALVTVVAWGDIMLGVAVMVAINGMLCFRLTRLAKHDVAQDKKHPLANIREVMRDANINRFVLINGLYNFGQTNFFAFLTLFMRDVALVSQPIASLSVGIAQAASAVARIGWGVISDTVFAGRRKGLTVGLGVVAVVGLIALILVGPGSRVYLGLGLALLLGLTIASFAPLVQTLAVETTEPRLAGSAMGYNMFGTHIGGMIGPPIFGAIVDATGGYGAGWLVTAAVVAIGVAVLAFGFRERER
ncbi:MAG: MFS transporter [Rhodospirillales bacterium]|nr:MFS transporter [Rhodospirillales bacterium]